MNFVSSSQRWRIFKKHLHFKYAPTFIDWLMNCATV